MLELGGDSENFWFLVYCSHHYLSLKKVKPIIVKKQNLNVDMPSFFFFQLEELSLWESEVMTPFPSPLLSSLAVLIAYPMGRRRGKEGKVGGRKRGRERAYQTTFKQNTVNHLSITPAFLFPSEQPSPHPHPCPLTASRWRSLVSISKSPIFLHFERLLILFLISDIFSENE